MISQNNNRWSLGPASAILWDIAADKNLPHTDHLEMTGRRVSMIVTYGVDENRHLILNRHLVFPTFRTIPNDTHASLRQDVDSSADLQISINGHPLSAQIPVQAKLDGRLMIECVTAEGLGITRVLLPCAEKPAAVEIWVLRNDSAQMMAVEITQPPWWVTTPGLEGEYSIETSNVEPVWINLEPGQETATALIFTARKVGDLPVEVDPQTEEMLRCEQIIQLHNTLRLETPEPELNLFFDFAKLRATESLIATKGGLMHAPGGGGYYAAVWANDSVEYVAPFFPFLGEVDSIDATINCFRHFARFMNPEYNPLPSSIIAEGIDIWAGAGDRGDAAMIAYGASRFTLALADREVAQELWPLIEWCLEYCYRMTTAEGVIASDSDELEGRFSHGHTNLNTSSLTFGALITAADLADALGDREALAQEYRQRAIALHAAINNFFSAEVEGYQTYRYHEGSDILRAWSCIPLTMGIFERAPGTIEALFSPCLWTADGLATEAGQITFWDRATLYALRGVFAAGDTDRALKYLSEYTNRRLLGEHVPYAVEAWPEGNQAQLSAESALYCRVITEGLFGLRPTGFRSFECVPRLPQGWAKMALRDIQAFSPQWSLLVERSGSAVTVSVLIEDKIVFSEEWTGPEPLCITLPNN